MVTNSTGRPSSSPTAFMKSTSKPWSTSFSTKVKGPVAARHADLDGVLSGRAERREGRQDRHGQA